MTTFVQLLATGLMVGSIYGLVALGFVLIYKSSKIFNLAQGEFLMVGSFVAWTFLSLFKLPIWAGIILTFVVLGGVGYGLERFPLRRMIGQSHLSMIMVTLGIAILLRGLATLAWAKPAAIGSMAYPKFLPTGTVTIFGAPYSELLIWSFVIIIVLVLMFAFFFRFTRSGLNMRATAEDQQVAQSMGIKVTGVIAQTWAIAAIVSAVGGILLGYHRGIDFGLTNLGLRAIAAALFGGLESIPGALIGGICIGVFESLAGGYIGHGFKEVAPYVAMALILILKPFGLMGLQRIERV